MDEQILKTGYRLQKSTLKRPAVHSATKAKAAQFRNVVEDAWSDAQSRAQTWQTEIGAYIQQNPTKAVFMAFS